MMFNYQSARAASWMVAIWILLAAPVSANGGDDVYVRHEQSDGEAADEDGGLAPSTLDDAMGQALQWPIGESTRSPLCHEQPAGTRVVVDRHRAPNKIAIVVTAPTCDGEGNLLDIDVQTAIVSIPVAKETGQR